MMKHYTLVLVMAGTMWAAGAGPATGQNATTAARLDPQPAAGAAPLPAGAGMLLSGYGQQAQGGLILAYFAAGTLGDALTAGSLSGADGRRQADSYLTLAASARDDLRRVRGAYALNVADLDELDKLNAAYGEVIPLIAAAQQLADKPADAERRAAFQAARRKAFATLGVLFNWRQGGGGG
jgi:hypothetical protein